MITVPGLRRDFPPSFIGSIGKNTSITILLEKGYGEDLGFIEEQYRAKNVTFTNREQCFQNAEIVVSLTAPAHSEILMMKERAILVSMLHFPTHPERNALMREAGIRAVSIDSLVDFEGRRMVQDLKNTAWNAITVGFQQLHKQMGDDWWFSSSRENITIMLLGFGEVGKHAAEAAMKKGKTTYIQQLKDRNGNTIVNVVPMISEHTQNNVHDNMIISSSLFKDGKPHMVVDTTQRRDNKRHIMTRESISKLPPECIIVDVSADQYDTTGVVKGIEGIPTGNETQYIFEPGDKAWKDNSLIPKQYQLDPQMQRTVVSHYAWPSYGTVENRIQNMNKYAVQLYPFILSLISNNPLEENPASEFWDIEKAIRDASLASFD